MLVVASVLALIVFVVAVLLIARGVKGSEEQAQEMLRNRGTQDR